MKAVKSSGNVFADIGLDSVEAEELIVKADLVTLLIRALRERDLTQLRAARLCGVDQPTLSKVLNGKLDSITIDRLAKWIVLLGGRIDINVRQPKARRGRYRGAMRVVPAR
jgi:predicted XRE-type DNA-binding protein